MHKIAIGCDPNAQTVKQHMIDLLRSRGYAVEDYGSDDPIYANVAERVAQAVVRGEADRGLLFCGTGIGMSLAANKVRGALAALITDEYSAERARLSNDANIACFGSLTLGIKRIEKYVEIFLENEFVAGCGSQPKVDRIRDIDNRH